ncbi:MAG: TniQ family protein [Acidobacteria bacterium]|nr:TniQ family protein [Acidobacteriota bacterium]
MLGFFTDPYPDELLYSAVARYHQRADYRSPDYTGWELFGTARGGASIDLPTNIEHLISVLPPGHGYTVNTLIDKHTQLPFYAAFLSSDRVNRLKTIMAVGVKHGQLHFLCGLVTSPHRMTHMRFCPGCATDDRERVGETYWHRLHQVPGVMVCHKHDALLQETDIFVPNILARREYMTAEAYIPMTPPVRPLDAGRRYEILRRIAQDAAWLLDQRDLTCELALLQNRYHGLLHDRGFMKLTANGWISKVGELQSAFTDFCDPHLLVELNCALRMNWLKRLYGKAFRPQPPLYHLLMMQFLGVSAKAYFALPERDAPYWYDMGMLGVDKPQRTPSCVRATPERLAFHRAKIQSFVAENPELSRSQIIKKLTRSYQWLIRYDPEWLKANLPAHRSMKGIPRRTNWAERDAALTDAIRAEAERLLLDSKPSGALIRVTKGRLCNRLGIAGIYMNLAMLPLTARAIEEVTETPDQFNLRRIAQGVEACRREGLQRVYKHTLLNRAAMSDRTRRFSPCIAQAIQSALDDLNS